MGPFYNYADGDGNSRYHNSWNNNYAHFINSTNPWMRRGGYVNNGSFAGQSYFGKYTGAAEQSIGFRIVLIN